MFLSLQAQKNRQFQLANTAINKDNKRVSISVQMHPNKLTLKEYITSYNYRKEIEFNAKSQRKYERPESGEKKDQSPNRRKAISTIKYESALEKKIREIILFARQVISDDQNFVQLEKMLERLKEDCIEEVVTQRQNQNILMSILRMGTQLSKNSTERNLHDFMPQEAKMTLQKKQPTKKSAGFIETIVEMRKLNTGVSHGQLIESTKLSPEDVQWQQSNTENDWKINNTATLLKTRCKEEGQIAIHRNSDMFTIAQSNKESDKNSHIPQIQTKVNQRRTSRAARADVRINDTLFKRTHSLQLDK